MYVRGTQQGMKFEANYTMLENYILKMNITTTIKSLKGKDRL